MTVFHVVLISWSPLATVEHREAARRIARSFPGNIPGVLSVVEGPSVSPENLEGPYDYGMVITFSDEHARDGYLPHPAHQAFVRLLGGGAMSTIAVFDIDGSS